MINRYTSRLKKLDSAFLNLKLKDALAYDRIAGYFSSSLFEVAGEALESIKGKIRIICNSSLDVEDIINIKNNMTAAKNAQRKEWCASEPEKKIIHGINRFERLHKFLNEEKMIVKVIPNKVFGLVHGKAGIITLSNGKKTAFLGSINETLAGWKKNYEIMWEDDSEEAVRWVQDEFDYFWNNQYAVRLTDFIKYDLKRIIKRKVIYVVDDWREESLPAATVIESPVYRKEFGLQEHQKYFINLAFTAHKKRGARFVLADQVGLGKTVQLALSAQLMALEGNKPILIIVPKTLLWQWQEELNDLLDIPSAVWTSKGWKDENDILNPMTSINCIKKCPRRIGIISQGLIISNSPIINVLLEINYECIIVDEAHRARRKNLAKGKENHSPEPNNLMRFLLAISRNTKSMLLATATPVQLYPVEAWDLLHILSQNTEEVFGNQFSKWKNDVKTGLDLVMGKGKLTDILSAWEWMRNPFPPKEEGSDFGIVRTKIDLPDDRFDIEGDKYYKFEDSVRNKINKIFEENFITEHNPFIRHIIRRTRDFLEKNINPETGESYLPEIKVVLFGENDDEAINLTSYLIEVYKHAEEFCSLLKERVKQSGFLKTLLLKRVGSTMIAGLKTAKKMLSEWGAIEEETDYEDEDVFEEESILTDNSLKNTSEIRKMTDEEKISLKKFIQKLEGHIEEDPKYSLVKDLLLNKEWLKRGCIIFTQYYDSAYWIARRLADEKVADILALYSGSTTSKIFINGNEHGIDREKIKKMIFDNELKLIVGTDAASEGLNLQSLGSLINLDLPWNPTRLEQRKGRIQRIGQRYDKIWIYNMRYTNSVEDRVHKILSSRLKEIRDLFGQIPDILEDAWIKVAQNEIEEAKRIIDNVPEQHPFNLRNNKVEHIDWETCEKVLDSYSKRKYLMKGWQRTAASALPKERIMVFIGFSSLLVLFLVSLFPVLLIAYSSCICIIFLICS